MSFMLLKPTPQPTSLPDTEMTKWGYTLFICRCLFEQHIHSSQWPNGKWPLRVKYVAQVA